MMLTCASMYLLRTRLLELFDTQAKIDQPTVRPERIDSEIASTISNLITEQTPIAIRDFSSQYGSNRSDSYVVSNVCSKPEIYPLYGDSTHALVFRTYGPWWLSLPSYQETCKYFTRWEHHFTSKDFIDIEFKDLVYQCVSLNIYETYNPGTLDAVYVGEEDEHGNCTWHRVWVFPQPFSIVLSNDEEFSIDNGGQFMHDLFPHLTKTIPPAHQPVRVHSSRQNIPKISTHHSCPPAARLPRIVKIPLKDKVAFPTRLVRLEFDHSTVNYYAEIDTIILCGQTSPVQSIQMNNDQWTPPPSTPVEERTTAMTLTQLPFDLLCIICSYLDLRSLVRLSSTCRSFHQQCLDPLQFQSLNLQPYWNGITNYSIENFFSRRCDQTRYLSLSWTRAIQCSSFQQLITGCSKNLLQLNLASCQYLTGQYIKIIVHSCPMIEILNLENCLALTNLDFIPLKYLNHVRSLNVYRTKIDYRTLLPFIDNNRKHLEHINLGACQKLIDSVGIVKLLLSRCSNLRSLDLWRAHALTANAFLSLVGLPFDIGEEKRRILNLPNDEQEELAFLYCSVNMPIALTAIGHLKYLREVDLGWTDPAPGFVRSFVQQIGHSLIKLFLTACRRVNNDDVIAVSEYCPQLRQLDLLGSSILVESAVECILKRCLELEFIDLSFCDKISDEMISIWMCRYECAFKRSYSPTTSKTVCREFP